MWRASYHHDCGLILVIALVMASNGQSRTRLHRKGLVALGVHIAADQEGTLEEGIRIFIRLSGAEGQEATSPDSVQLLYL